MFDRNGNLQKVIAEIELDPGYEKHVIIDDKSPFINKFNEPRAVCISRRNARIFISDSRNHRVLIFSSSWKLLLQFGSFGDRDGQLNNPRGLAISDCGQYVFVCDRNNHRVQVFNTFNGSFVKNYGTKGDTEQQIDRKSVV